jgi:hypothetical protein
MFVGRNFLVIRHPDTNKLRRPAEVDLIEFVLLRVWDFLETEELSYTS